MSQVWNMTIVVHLFDVFDVFELLILTFDKGLPVQVFCDST